MPELPEVETVRSGLAAVLEGRRLCSIDVRRRDLRIPLPMAFSERLEGRRVVRLRRRAKYILAECDDGTVLIVHLGMSGRMLIEAHGSGVIGRFHNRIGPNQDHEHIVFATDDGTLVRFSDPRRFGLMTLSTTSEINNHPLLRNLGPEPMDPDFTGPVLWTLLSGKQTPIKSALLDQRIVAGLGNIYVCESLYLAGISPRRKAANLGLQRSERLVEAIREVLAAAIEAGGSTLRDHIAPSGEIGYFQHRFKVYAREGEPCSRCDCGKTIRRIVQSGRSTFYCPTRQR